MEITLRVSLITMSGWIIGKKENGTFKEMENASVWKKERGDVDGL